MPPKRKLKNESEDELSDDYEEDTGFTPGKLNPPVAGTIALLDLYKMICTGEIDLNVEFQRDVVWPATKQQTLILSIMQNFPIPQIYFSLRRDPDGREYHATLDGKQRLTSIWRFFEGEIPYVPEGSKTRWYYKETPNVKQKRMIMSSDQKHTVEQKTLTCIQYQGLNDMQERDMFQRVQLGMPLKEGEKLQSLGGAWPAWIMSLVKNYVEKDGTLADLLDWETARGAAFQHITLAVCTVSNVAVANHRSYSALHKFLTTQKNPPREEFKKAFEDTLKRLIEIAKSRELRHPFREGTPRVAPIEFSMTCILMYLMRGRGLFEIAREIDNMRTDVRQKHVDVRSNTRVFITMWAYCQKVVGSSSRDAEYLGETKPKKRKG